MVATPADLRPVEVPGLEIVRVEADGLDEAIAVAAAGFEVPAEIVAKLFTPGLVELDGLALYVGRVGGRAVSTAIGLTVGAEVGIFDVATPPEHRRRGYGGALTTRAARDGFAAGADLAWLQSSAIGESTYRRLGFRQVETYVLLSRGA
jgi:ribosomal protein S18 acetylase RimI-like enzyme